MKRTITRLTSAAALVTLMAAAPALAVETPPVAAKMAGIGELIKLLREKGVISEEEAGTLERRIAGEEKKQPEAPPEPVVTAEAGAAEQVKLTFAEASDLIGAMNDQGIISTEESLALKERLYEIRKEAKGKLDSPVPAVERKETADIFAGTAIEYRRSTKSEQEVAEMVAAARGIGLVSREESSSLMARYRAKAETDQLTGAMIDEVNRGVGESIDRRVTEEMTKVDKLGDKFAKLPEWLNRFKFSGDIRLRYQGDYFAKGNAGTYNNPVKDELINTTVDRQRVRIRARLGINAKVNDEVEAVLKLATGNDRDPVSTNDTLGNNFNKHGFVLDLAYLQWKPTGGMALWGGRMPSPWFSTDLVWDPDLNFEGIAATYAGQFTDSFGGFLTAGIFPVQEIELSQRDKWLWGVQGGMEFRHGEDISAKLGVAYYSYENLKGKLSKIDGEQNASAITYAQKGNTFFDINRDLIPGSSLPTGLASNFKELNVTAAVDFGFWDPIHFVFMGDYVKNLGFDLDEAQKLTGDNLVKDDSTGYQVGLAVGHQTVTKPWEWKSYLFYKKLGADAVYDGFTDSDFHLGGTNAKGWILGGDVGILKNFWLSTKWLTANQITDTRAKPGPFDVDVFQFNLNGKF
ncbi:putative porin [Geobacter grbiciae]|uniref:putative porin n=1 Tax=Geobacter grbiciae TaxID=155042 RepID=UPI001C01A77E|nr:putative porin [Geobacter grbiciae]MBT1076747.1 putative porin [Geobacter grbiciae]